MAKDIEPKVYGTVTRLDGTSAGGSAFVQYSGPVTGGTGFTVRPPETGAKWQDAWSRNPIVIVFRALCLTGMWLTDYWWRVAILLALIAALATLFIVG
jgi:hypothetical protein